MGIAVYALDRPHGSVAAGAVVIAAGVYELTCAQKLLPAKAAVDVPLALAIAGLGLVIVLAPSQVPGLMPQMM